jgi:hypothetical protein
MSDLSPEVLEALETFLDATDLVWDGKEARALAVWTMYKHLRSYNHVTHLLTEQDCKISRSRVVQLVKEGQQLEEQSDEV